MAAAAASGAEAFARSVGARLIAAGHLAYLTGGCVRDGLLGREPKDYDLATSARPEDVQRLFPRTVAVGARFGVILVVGEGVQVEVASFRSDGAYTDGRRPVEVRYSTPQEDAHRRDFTVNGLFEDLASGAVLDFVGGRADLQARLLRAIGDPEARFREDHLRLLRAVRFAVELDFELEDSTAAAIPPLAGLLATVSGERVRDELARILVHPHRRRGFERLRDLGLLSVILPEIAAMQGVPQPPQFHPEGDVWIHTLLCLEHLEQPSFELALAMLLHDIAKPVTIEHADRIRFNNHDTVGVRMSESVCARLKLSQVQTERVLKLVELHLRFAAAPHMRPATLRRFLAEPVFDDLVKLGRADCLGSHGDTSLIDFCLAQRVELAAAALPPPLLRGRDLLALGLPPGPEIGRLLKEVEEQQLAGELADREAALTWVRGRIG